LIALRCFNLPVGSRLGSHRTIENRFVRVGAAEANPRFQVHRLVEGDPVDPGAEFRLAAKRLDGVVNFEKHLLRHVFASGMNSRPRIETARRKTGALMAANQFRESLLVAALYAGDELGIALHER
jgi:hypothetical protein